MALQNVQYINLRSTDRSSGTDGRATFRIPQRDLPEQYTMFFQNASIPYTFYQIEAPNNVFVFRETGGVTATAQFTIPPGNYTSFELSQLLETEMSANSPNTLSYTVTYNFNNGKMTFETNSADTVEFQNTMSLSLFLKIGFYTDQGFGKGYRIRDDIAGTSITSPSFCQAGPSSLIIESNLRSRGFHTAAGDINTMAVVPLNGSAGDWLTYEPNQRIELFAAADHGLLTNITITIRRDDTVEPISSFNGVPWTVSIGLRGHDA